MKISLEKFCQICFIFCSKYTLWIRLNRLAETVEMSTHTVCFGPKIRKFNIPCEPQCFYTKVGFKGVNISRKCFPDVHHN